MSHNREWDRGKGDDYNHSWSEGDSWRGGGSGRNDGGYPGRGRREREDDDHGYYGGDGKRRRYNDDAGSSAYGEGSYTSYGNYHTDNGDDWNNGYDDPDDRSYNQRGGFPKKKQVASEPSAHVIFLGLDLDFTEADLQKFLTDYGCSLETATIIRDRSTGLSKGFGFAQFASIEQARKFVDPNFPFISVPPPASHGASATATYYKAVEAGAQHNGRRVKIDYSQSAQPGGRGGPSKQTNDGTRDIGNSQAPVLLFRGLDPLSGVPAIEQALRASAGVGKQGARGMKRIVLIKDKVTNASWGFAFVEFVDIKTAATTLGAILSPQIHPAGFRISDRPVAGSWAHPYSFQLIPDAISHDETCIPSSTSMGGLDGSWTKYWDEAATCVALEFEVEQPRQMDASQKEKKEKKKAKPSPDPSATATELKPLALPASDKPVTLNFKGGTSLSLSKAVNVPKPAATTSLGFSALEDPTAPNDEDESGRHVAIADSKTVAKAVPPLIMSKKVASNITKWNQVQEELSSDRPPDGPQIHPSQPSVSPGASPKPEAKQESHAVVTASENDFEFSDLVKMACLLCSRQFKTLDQLKRHNNESSLHKKNHEDSILREVARGKAKAAHRSDSKDPEQPKYRDRASERRVMHNQPEAPLPDPREKAGRRRADGPPPPPPPPPPPVHPGQDQNNVGNKLLKMMGWTEGTGLGTSADGRIDPIETAIYATGVGLGASKGVEIGKYTEGYSGYVDMVKDGARERYGT